MPKEPTPLSYGASLAGGQQGSPKVAAIMLTVLGHMKPRLCRMVSAFKCDGMPRAFCLFAMPQACQRPCAIHGDGLVTLRLHGIDEPFHG